LQISWSRTAAKDLDEIEAYLAERNPIAAIEQILAILDQVESLLPTHPQIGRGGRVNETRELVIVNTKFIAIYQISDTRIDILRILHGARDWPKEV